ncbi:DNase I-like protein [Westerdykella ornata]|uniref:DNA-(apurinic or apyrimidinic site) endonuclease 2 n=1 Tax=Westerdykella ornata TaxID=318751 RepID=A0A6A6JUY5_WESOR|nr:DNase I-like protein [Westerdykella ornata]KAF2279556.1 DNase I-like protein [Westerdykella ornata]
MVRITTWNVNGIRNPFGYQPWRETRSFSAMFDILEADIVILQELKIQRKDLTDDMVLVPGWDCFFSLPKYKKGYSGVAIYTRQSVCAPIRAEEGLLGVLCPPGSSVPYRELPEQSCIGGYPNITQLTDLGVDPLSLDAEGRCVVVEFPAFVVVGVYSPANSSGTRDDFSFGFRCALDSRIRNLARLGKNVILAGDLNVSREEIDSARAEESMREEGETVEQYLNRPTRRLFNQLVENGKVPGQRDEGRETPILWDICREFHPAREGMYTHWEQKINARPGNFGSRIDYVLCSIDIKDWFCDANIQEGLMGSDHCPVYASIKEIVKWRGEQVHILDILNPPGMFKDGKRLRDYDTTVDILASSGKRLPEFTKRRSIKDMFASKSNPMVPTMATPAVTSQGSAQLSETRRTGEEGALGAQEAESPSAAVSPIKASQKRRLASGSPVKPVKRSKSNARESSPSQPPIKGGQQSLRGFFISKPTRVISDSEQPPMNGFNSTVPADVPTAEPADFAETKSGTDSKATQQTWSKLFSKKPLPRCEHGEPCTIYTVKKAGPNCGRQFFLCSRPLGPSGQKERGTEWRCPTYIWASDWKNSS